MLGNDYPNDEFVHIDWHTSGFLANGSGSARAGYYGISAVPDVYFDGRDNVLGAGDSVSAYNTYKPILDSHLTDPNHSKFLLSADVDFNGNTLLGSITVDLEVAPGHTIGTPGNVSVRAAVYEDHIIACCEPRTGNSVWENIGRLMIFEVPLTAVNAGDQQQVIQGFAVDPSWKVQDLHALAWIQRDTNKKVLQAAKAAAQFGVSVVDLGPAVVSTPGTPVTFDTEVTYRGTVTDDVTVTLDKTALPIGWDAEVIWAATTDPNSVTIPAMTTGQMETVTIRTIPSASAGMGTVTATTVPASNPSLQVVRDYHTFSNTPAILFVDDDNGAAYEADFEGGILGAGYYSITQEVDAEGNPSAAYMSGFDAVVWNTGELQSKTIGPNPQGELRTYLDGGGRLFLSSHGYLNHQGITTFTSDYLGVSAFSQDAQAPSATGVAGDPIGDGLSFALSPPFPDFADAVTPGLGTIWLQGPNGDIGVRYEGGAFRTVFLSAAYEGIPAGDQPVVMGRILDWLLGGAVGVQPIGGPTSLTLSLGQNAPNPFRGATAMRFTVPRDGPVRLTVYDVAGRKVAELVNRTLNAGAYTVPWDGRTASGTRASSGVYMYRLQAGTESIAKEMVILK